MTYATAIHVLELARELRITPDTIQQVCSELKMELSDGVLSTSQAEVVRSQVRGHQVSQAGVEQPAEQTMTRPTIGHSPSEDPPPGQFLSDYLASSPDTIEELAAAPPPAPSDRFPAPAPSDRFPAPAATPPAPPAFTMSPTGRPGAPPEVTSDASDRLEPVSLDLSELAEETDPQQSVVAEVVHEPDTEDPQFVEQIDPESDPHELFDFDDVDDIDVPGAEDPELTDQIDTEVDLYALFEDNDDIDVTDEPDTEDPELTDQIDTEVDLYALFENEDDIDLDADRWDPDLANDLEDEALVQMGATRPGILFRMFNERKEARSTLAGGDAHGHLATGIAEEWRPRWFWVFLATGLLTGAFAYANIDRPEPRSGTASAAVCYEQMVGGDLNSLAPVACNESHDFESIGNTEFPTTGLAPYPDAETFDQFGSPLCSSLFESYTGRLLDESRLQISVAPPSSSGWIDAGDRTLRCLVSDPSGPRVGSLSLGQA